MGMDPWVIVLEDVTATGNVSQLYPAYCPAGVARATATNGQLIRSPTGGTLLNIQIETDGTNAGILQLYDINGEQAGADVSSAVVITDTQLDAAIAAGNAKLIYEQNFAALPSTPIFAGPRSFTQGLAARFVASGGQITLNLVVNGGYRLTNKVG